MLNIAIGLFVVAALVGAVMALSILKGRLAPWALSLLHAALGAAGLVILVLLVMDGGYGSLLATALGILVVAALGGFYLASIHARKLVAPFAIVLVHAAVAAVGLILLIVMIV